MKHSSHIKSVIINTSLGLFGLLTLALVFSLLWDIGLIASTAKTAIVLGLITLGIIEYSDSTQARRFFESRLKRMRRRQTSKA